MSQYEDSFNICPSCGFEEGTLPSDSRCITPGEILADRYIVGMPLGIDSWMIRYIGWDALTNRRVTVNEYLPVRYAARNMGELSLSIVREKPFYRYLSLLLKRARLLSETHIPDNVASVSECFEKNKTGYIITDHCEGKPLGEYIKEKPPLKLPTVEKLFLPMLRSLDKLNDSGYIVGGFSPESFIVTDDNELILSDYIGNMFFNLTEGDDLKPAEADRYYPPERLSPSDTPDLSPQNDVFSSAMIMYSMLGADIPDGRKRLETYEKKNKDILKKPSAYKIKLDGAKENALINASAFDITYRTQDMETFIKEFSGSRTVELNFRKGKGFPVWAKFAVPAAAVILVVAASLFIPKLFGGNDDTITTDVLLTGQTIVPSVVNYDLSAAADELKKAGLMLQVEGRTADDSRDENIVLTQNVDKGTLVEENSVIGVTVSVHSGEFTLPNFLGLKIGECTKVIETIGLNYSVTEEYNKNISSGCVTYQSITPYTTVKAGQRIDLAVSKGADPADNVSPTPEKVDGYVGQTYESLSSPSSGSSADFPVQVSERVYDDSVPEGTVLQQYPAPGTTQSTDEPVQLVVSTKNESVTVPDLTLITKEDAQKLLDMCSLKAEFGSAPDDNIAQGLIYYQVPAAGTHAKPGDTVKLVISEGKKAVKVPDTVGKTRDEAAKAIKNAGLSPMFTYDTDAGKEKDIILSQSISAGSEVKPGTEILLTVNSRDTVVKVPDIIGLELEEADRLAKEAGMNLLIYVDDDHPYSDGRVTAQGPKAGLAAEKGADLVVLMSGNGQAAESSAPSGSTSGSSGPDIKISPENVTIRKGEQFVLTIDVSGIDDLSRVEYDISDESVVGAIHVDKSTLDMTYLGVSPGTAQIRIYCGSIERICNVTVTA